MKRNLTRGSAPQTCGRRERREPLDLKRMQEGIDAALARRGLKVTFSGRLIARRPA